MSNTTRRNRRQEPNTAQDAQVQDPTPDAQEPQEPATEQDATEPQETEQDTQVPGDSPAPEEPATEQEPQAPAQPAPDPEPAPPAQEETPATDAITGDDPIRTPLEDAAGNGWVSAPGETPGDSTPPEDEPATAGPADERREPTAAELLAIAASTDLTVPQDFRESAFASAAVMLLRELLGKVAALPADQPLTGDWTRLQISGANGRGVAGAKAALQVIVAMFGFGYYEGSTHDSIKGVADRRMQVTAFIPDIFRGEFAALMHALNDDGGVVFRQEQIVRKAQQDKKKLSGLPAGTTEYGFVNVPSRKAMVACGERIAAVISAQFPADDPQVQQIRQVITACQMAYVPGGKNAVLFQATAKYAVAPEPAAVPELVTAQA